MLQSLVIWTVSMSGKIPLKIQTLRHSNRETTSTDKYPLLILQKKVILSERWSSDFEEIIIALYFK